MAVELQQPVLWPDAIDDVLTGDLVVTVGSPTPKGGVVLNSVAPIGLRDRAAGTVTFTTSLGFGRKLERIAADPRIAVAYHTRQHGRSRRPGVVLVQGVASVRADLSGAERTRLARQAAEHLGPVVSSRFWDWWLAVYYQDRVCVDVRVARIVWWPTEALGEQPIVLGRPIPEQPPAAQAPPRNAATPRVAMRKLRRSVGMPHLLIGYIHADGMPCVLPVTVTAVDDTAVIVGNDTRLLPPGGRRAGFLAHDFRPKLVGLSTATHTGWLVVDEQARWTPHTRHSFTAPPNKTLLLLGNGAAARWGYRQAIRHGRDQILRYGRRAGD
jgi:hypothetical protein